MHKRGLCCLAVSVCLSVSSKFFLPSGSQGILVFPCHTRDGDIPTGTPLMVASNAGGVGTKRDSERISLHTLHAGLQCCKPYDSRSVKNKAATDGVEPSTHGGDRRRCSHKTTTKCL